MILHNELNLSCVCECYNKLKIYNNVCILYFTYILHLNSPANIYVELTFVRHCRQSFLELSNLIRVL